MFYSKKQIIGGGVQTLRRKGEIREMEKKVIPHFF
jgi:hypothetical protein